VTSPEGMAYTALAGLAGSILKDWYKERKARKAIIRLFQECFVDSAGKVKIDRAEVTVANLTFRLNTKPKFDLRIGHGYEVVAINGLLPGDNFRRRRSFRYWDKPHMRMPGIVVVTWAPLYYQMQYFRR